MADVTKHDLFTVYKSHKCYGNVDGEVETDNLLKNIKTHTHKKKLFRNQIPLSHHFANS